ncbi:MAG: zf-TFIIB domain-containing protein [Candidatus Weimeria sp.]|nr:zf-TFIIB domain-containing protein [Candidatus Weimeria sp.]
MFRNRLQQLMIGRNGPDALGRFTMFVVLLLFILSTIAKNGVIYLLGLAVLGYGYFRMMSKNVGKRYLENQKYLQITDRMKNFFYNHKTYRFYKCPTCKQKVRVPRGHGKIEITCPKCRGTFIRRS